MDGAWELVSCLLCGRDDARPLLEGPDRLHNLPGRFRFVQCRACGLVYQNPRLSPAAMRGYYPDEYPPHTDGQRGNPWTRLDARVAYGKRVGAIRRVLPSVSGGRVLDVGCGSGGFLQAMANAGWQVYGLEPSPRAAELARKASGAQIIEARLEEADLPVEFFDVVTLWDVIEHLHDPLAGLERVARALKPGGLLVISTPDFGSPDRRLFGRYWFGYDLPRHLYIFSRDTASALLSGTGFRVLAVRHFTAHYQVLAGSIRHVVADLWGDRAARVIYRLVYSPVARVVTLPLVRALAMANIGPIMTIFARKAANA